jgi:hypothetical protein
MSHLVRRLAACASSAVAVSAVLLALPGTASATSGNPPWEPDTNSGGGLLFYNSAGQQVFGGSTTDQPIAAYVEGTAAPHSGDTKATLYGFTPVIGQQPTQWSGESLGLSTNYPNVGAPAPLNNATLPVETGGASDETLADYILDFPNNDTSTTDGYSGLYQLRLYTSTSGSGLSQKYDAVDISVTGSTWTVVYPLPTTATTTSLAVSPASPVLHGKPVKLTATVTPADAAGSVEFLDGSKVLSTAPVAGGTAAYTTTALSDATHRLTAQFVPGAGFAASTSTVHSLVVRAQATSVTLTASTHTLPLGKKLTLTAKETPTVAGTVAFLDGSKKLASVKVSRGKAVFSTTKLKLGTHVLKAKFTPANTQADAVSTSRSVAVKVVK